MIRSTNIRQHLRAGETPASLSDIIPEPVAAYIAAYGLYR
jgi:nicotinic acid mononucleotide adenylyltransferase